MQGAKLWLVGKHRGDGPDGSIAWEFSGIFATEDEAVAACRDHFYFVGPCVVGEIIPDEPIEWPESYYPLIAKES